MLDFIQVKVSASRKDVVDVYPEFITRRSKDLMIKGNRFYAIWNDELNLWTKSEYDAQVLIDNETIKFANEYDTADKKVVKLLKNFSSRKWTEWKQYCNSMPDSYHELDEKVVFQNQEVKKTDYVTKRLPYNLEEGDISAYEELISTLYDPEERQKLEWAVGAIISGDSKRLQKFIVLEGEPGSGKSTFLNIVQNMFPGYYATFSSKSLTNNSEHALEAFKENPLIAIEHDGDLSRIEDNTRLNSIVSHEELVVNEKFKNLYTSRFKSFLFMGTNKPVKITDSKSGLIRRLIDVYPSGRLVPEDRYNELLKKISFEYGPIAYHCLEVYKSLGYSYYTGYKAIRMIQDTNDFYNFVNDVVSFYMKDHNGPVSIDKLWGLYKDYVTDSKLQYSYTKIKFKSEIKNYFTKCTDNRFLDGFKEEKFKSITVDKKEKEIDQNDWLFLKEQDSLFDSGFEGCLAQYANEDGIPKTSWAKCKTKLMDLDTRSLHYVKLPYDIIKVDFDLKDQNGNKSLALNLQAAREWPETYAEVSQSGNGLHLYYFYKGDPTKLKNIYSKDIEIKVHTGNNASRRKLSLCNSTNIATIYSGLPLKEDKNVLNASMITNERSLRYQIVRNLRKEIHEYTKPSIDFIYKILEDAYNSGLKYDLRDMAPDIQQFANNSSHNADYCLNVVSKMKFVGKETEQIEPLKEDGGPIIFYDVEVFPNLFILCWKKQGKDSKVIKMINPTPEEVRSVFQFKVIGFNNRNYDNHICWARMMGYTNEQLFDLSQRIINDGVLKNGFTQAYDLSYTDVYDFLSASNKMSLKKWEIQLGIYHLENSYPWDQNVDESHFKEIADYCANDVIATEAVFDANQADFRAREILADLSGLSVNNTTNQCTAQIILGDDKHPQDKFIYTDLSEMFPGYEYSPFGIERSKYNEGTKIVKGRSLYKGEDPGEGGYVYANPGIYYDVGLFDVESMHPTSCHQLKMFGPYDEAFWSIVQIRLNIKHKNYEPVRKAFNGKLAKYLGSEDDAKDLSNALKTAINSVYGLTSSTFPNRLRDPRNIDNIVAKRGALFMINLKYEVESRGYKVVHIKTDSIKVAKYDDSIKQFIMEYGKKYGYNFEHEATYGKMCLVNESTYIALVTMYKDKDYKDNPFWTATGTQFQVPYVFKTMFSHENIEFKDLCETKTVTTSMYLDFNEDLEEDKHDYRFVGRVGLFCPVQNGAGGAVLYRKSDEGKYSAVTGTKGYRWMESEMVRKLGIQDKIDISYYDRLVKDAKDNIAKFGDADYFMTKELLPEWMNPPEEELPFN